MKTAKHAFTIIADQPGAALVDVLGLTALVAMIFGGFVATLALLEFISPADVSGPPRNRADVRTVAAAVPSLTRPPLTYPRGEGFRPYRLERNANLTPRPMARGVFFGQQLCGCLTDAQACASQSTVARRPPTGSPFRLIHRRKPVMIAGSGRAYTTKAPARRASNAARSNA